jgi:hypothetical protein
MNRLPPSWAEPATRAPVIALMAMLMVCGVEGCGETRSSSSDYEITPVYTYLDDIAPLISRKCQGCHGEGSSTDLSTWIGLMRYRAKAEGNLVAGDAESKLLTTLSDDQHRDLMSDQQRELIHHWVVDDHLAYFSRATGGYHPASWLDSRDRNAADFHGGYLRARSWQMQSCQRCHGEGYTTCKSCHEDGPTAGCSACHGAGKSGGPPPSLSGSLDPTHPGVGQHAAHKDVDCSACHIKPETLEDDGHLFDDDNQRSDLRAEVVFGTLAKAMGSAPRYDSQTGRCSNVHCHAGDGAVKEWSWTQHSTSSIACDSCHGNPPKTTRSGRGHPQSTACEGCHRGAYKNGQLDSKAHINGALEVF